MSHPRWELQRFGFSTSHANRNLAISPSTLAFFAPFFPTMAAFAVDATTDGMIETWRGTPDVVVSFRSEWEFRVFRRIEWRTPEMPRQWTTASKRNGSFLRPRESHSMRYPPTSECRES